MGNCASSKYAVDEDKAPKKVKLTKKQKKALEAGNGAVETTNPSTEPTETPAITNPEEDSPKSEQTAEKIDFIDENTQQTEPKVDTSTVIESKLDEDAKKEVTTYQTTVVKHSQKEGDELMNHLKTEAFRTLQNLLKKQDVPPVSVASTTVTMTTASSNDEKSEPINTENEDIVSEIKAQALISIGAAKQETVFSIVDYGTNLIKDNSVTSFEQLLEKLETKFPEDTELVGKVLNSTTGFLTAKGTEAGSLLSNILANVSTGLQGVMNETEKTTVKVTRTVTEQVMSGGQMREVTRVITSDQPVPGSSSNNIEDVLRNLQNGLSVDGNTFIPTTIMVGQPEITRTKVVQSGTTESSTSHSEKHVNVEESSVKESSLEESLGEDSVTRLQAETVVSRAVNNAVEKLSEESVEKGHFLVNGVQRIEENELQEHITEENIKIEEESSIKASTTKIVLNGEESVTEQIERAQSEFARSEKKEGKSRVTVVNGEESVEGDETSEVKEECRNENSVTERSEISVA